MTEKYDRNEIIDRVRLTPEQQYRYATKYWVEIFLRTCVTLAEDMNLGWKKVNEALLKSSKDGWPMVLDSLKRLSIEERDARVWAFAEVSAGVNAWPGYTDEVVELSPKRTAIKGTGKCIVLETAREFKIDRKIDLCPWCASSADAYLRKINSKLRVIQTKAMCRGDSYDYGYAELADNVVTGFKHAYEQVRRAPWEK